MMDPLLQQWNQHGGAGPVAEDGLVRLYAERNTARNALLLARRRRDAASVYYDSVCNEPATVTLTAWDAYREAQDALDAASDRLSALTDTLLDLLKR
jgi:hypothetical protein